MWYLLYNLLLLLASPVIVLVLLAKKRCRRGLLERLGLSGFSGLSRSSGFSGRERPDQPDTPEKPDQPNDPVIWIHAVSLGETAAIVPLVKELQARYPGWRLVVSTVTETGREAVEQRLKGVAQHCYAPLDFPWVVARVVRRLDPRLFLFVETELWPNLLQVLHRRGVPCVMLNGRLSSSSFRGYLRIRPLMVRVLSSVRLFLMQSDRDAERVIALGADPKRVVRVGNVKFDHAKEAVPAQPAVTRADLGIPDRVPVVVAGSTHPVEEEAVLDGFGKIIEQWPDAALVLAPRHIERAAEVEAAVRVKGWAVSRRSRMNGGPKLAAEPVRVVILDTRGELAQAYRLATVAFVGGTLVPVGGHNLLEPALWGKPVLFGPHTDHCEESAARLLEAGAGTRVRDGQELGREAESLVRDEVRREQMGQAALRVMTENRGAVKRSLDLLDDLVHRSSAGQARGVSAR